ncbi:MAG: mechanosensitive ion channel domain-containing protein [Geitlerinemataceae cyanobacterium]
MRRIVFVRIQAVIATGLISVFAVFGLPALSQEAEGTEEESESVLIESTIPTEVDPAKAVTVQDLTIPVDQLELLVKPLTLEELQTEAAAWLLLLKDKVQEISQSEIAIKRQNLAIESQESAAKLVTEAEAKLAEAEAAQAQTSPGTPEYEKATQQVEEAKQALQEARQAIRDAVTIGNELKEDKGLQAVVDEAESEEEISSARQVLEEAEAERDELTAGSADYDEATEKIDALDRALIDLEVAEENLEGAVPDSPEFKELSAKVDAARAKVIQASKAISDSGLAPSEAEEEGSVESEEAGEALKDIATDLKTAQQQTGTEAGDGAEEATQDSGEDLTEVAEQLEDVAEAESDLKNQLVVNVTDLQGEQTAIIDRFQIVLDAIDGKGGDTASYRTYIKAVSGIELNVTDTEGLGVRLVSWVKSEEGGLRWGLNLAQFLGIVIASLIVSRLVALILKKVLTRVGSVSSLFREFIVIVVGRGILVAGVLLALTSLGVSLGPIIALVGGASFVLAFALQSNLGNLASGLMLLLNKPFDVGDEIKVAGYWAYVDSISLANTKLKGFDGSIVSLPNNTVWGSDIINYTHTDMRKIVLPINVKFTQDLEKVRSMWIEIASSHPKVLDTPAPGWFPWNTHFDYYIPVGLSAWATTEDFWVVYVDLLKLLQKRIGELDIELAAPQQEIKLYQGSADKIASQLPSSVLPMSSTSLDEGLAMSGDPD